ncbi:MAG: hypothetical protein ACI9UN_002689 [Granulosicoccus sp.]|jgi:hypothetical protein
MVRIVWAFGIRASTDYSATSCGGIRYAGSQVLPVADGLVPEDQANIYV